MTREEALQRRVERLEEDNESLRQQVAAQRAALRAPVAFPHHWGLGAQHETLLAALLRADWASREVLLAQMSRWGRGWSVAGSRLIDVRMCQLRKAIRPIGAEIETLRGRGYRLPPASKAIVLREAAA